MRRNERTLGILLGLFHASRRIDCAVLLRSQRARQDHVADRAAIGVRLRAGRSSGLGGVVCEREAIREAWRRRAPMMNAALGLTAGAAAARGVAVARAQRSPVVKRG